uniref:Protein krueppel n=1 Tax=Photinus pyralis TaxID=7054 RepID=A0A1Y1NFH2_PHOPY
MDQSLPGIAPTTIQILDSETLNHHLVCRTCLCDVSNTTQSVFDSNIDKMLMHFTALQIHVDDGLPTQICANCIIQITQAYHFKQQAESSDTTLRQYFYVYKNPSQSIMGLGEISEGATTSEEKLLNNKTQTVDKNIGCNIPLNIATTQNTMENDIEPLRNVKCLSLNIRLRTDQHGKLNNHTCGICYKPFPTKRALQTHNRTHGILERRHKCSVCEKKFYAQTELTIHMRKHTGERPLVCTTCQKRFADPRSLAKHVKIHIGEKKFVCEICQKKFIHSYSLTTHRRVHTGEKPFVCSTCGHSYTTSTQLTLHTRTHTQEKPYPCSVCPKVGYTCSYEIELRISI